MAFADVDELASYLQTTIGPDKSASAELAVDLATGLIKADLGQHVDQATETVTFPPNFTNVLLLPEIPVTAVVSVTYDGEALVSDDYRWDRAGVVTKQNGLWEETTAIEYTHGYAATDVPVAIKAVCLSVAARYFDNPKGFDSKSGDNFSVSYFRSQGALSDAERRMLNPFRP